MAQMSNATLEQDTWCGAGFGLDGGAQYLYDKVKVPRNAQVRVKSERARER